MTTIGWLCWPCPFWWRMDICFFPSWLACHTQILSSSSVCCWISQFSTAWRTFKERTSTHPMHLLAMMEHPRPLLSHKLAPTLDPALLFSTYISIFMLSNVFCNLCSVPRSLFPPELYGQSKMKVKEREALIVYEALNSCTLFSTSASSHSFSQPSLVFLNSGPRCCVTLLCAVKKFQLWAMQNLFLKIPWDYWES